ncbi:MAG: hypothetical protein DLM50_06550 [Candidatus Meridianibacter frigidus]|nr:MAG: hypothetical protein DLM50_06550 [Candidatus Eremiobacteraeota bacterium]
MKMLAIATLALSWHLPVYCPLDDSLATMLAEQVVLGRAIGPCASAYSVRQNIAYVHVRSGCHTRAVGSFREHVPNAWRAAYVRYHPRCKNALLPVRYVDAEGRLYGRITPL